MKTYAGSLKYRGFEIELNKTRGVVVGKKQFASLSEAMDSIDMHLRTFEKRTVAMKAEQS